MISPIAVVIAFVAGVVAGAWLFSKFIDFVCNVAAKRDAGLGHLFGVEDARKIIATMARQSHLLRWVRPSEIAPSDSRIHGASMPTAKKTEGLAQVIELRNDSDRTRGVSAGPFYVTADGYPPRTTPLTDAERKQLEIDVQESLRRVGVKR